MTQTVTDAAPVIRHIAIDELDATADLRHAMDIELNGPGGDYDTAHPGWRERYIRFFTDLLQTHRGQFFVAEVGGTFVGSAAVYKLVNHRSVVTGLQSAYVCTVYVRPQWRRRGIARALTAQTVEWAKQNGCDIVRLRTSSMGRRVYEGLGFRQSDELELRI